MKEKIEGKCLGYFDQIITCPNGHEILVRNVPGFVEISFGPWDYTGRRAVGTTSLGMLPVLKETSATIHCLSCPDETVMHIQFRHRPDSKFRMYATVVENTGTS